MLRFSMTVPIEALLLWMSGAPPRISTVSVRSPSSSVIGMRLELPTWTSISLRSIARKPEIWAFSMYRPGGIAGIDVQSRAVGLDFPNGIGRGARERDRHARHCRPTRIHDNAADLTSRRLGASRNGRKSRGDAENTQTAEHGPCTRPQEHRQPPLKRMEGAYISRLAIY